AARRLGEVARGEVERLAVEEQYPGAERHGAIREPAREGEGQAGAQGGEGGDGERGQSDEITQREQQRVARRILRRDDGIDERGHAHHYDETHRLRRLRL